MTGGEPGSLRSSIATSEGKRRYVRRLFATIADRYDLITRLLSYGQDQRWKRLAIRLARPLPGDRVLDLACGTGDLIELAAPVVTTAVGLDVTHRMLQLALERQRRRRPDGPQPARCRARYVTGDMLDLPFPDASFDLVTTGYGLRNVPDLEQSVKEIARVLDGGGRLVSLDFDRPRSGAVRAVYLAYLTAVGSVLGAVLHGDPDTYRYIPESIRHYPGSAGVADLLARRGFVDVRVVPVLGGLMALHVATRAR